MPKKAAPPDKPKTPQQPQPAGYAGAAPLPPAPPAPPTPPQPDPFASMSSLLQDVKISSSVEPTCAEVNAKLLDEFAELANDSDTLLMALSIPRTVKFPEYRVVFNTPLPAAAATPPIIQVGETFIERVSSERLKEWKMPPHTIKPPVVEVDMFKSKANYAVTSFADLGRLNTEMRAEIKNWAFFAESSKCTEPIRGLVANAREVNGMVKAVVMFCADYESVLAQCQVSILSE
jgi:hypothetical protein